MKRFRLMKKRFIKNEDGVTAVEFSLVALPFFTLLFAIIEVSLIFAASLVLENGTLEAARQIRTGQIEGSDVADFDNFRDTLCGSINFLIDCEEVHIDVTPYADFRSSGEPDPFEGGDLGSSFDFDTGTAGDVVLVRVFATWDIITPIMGRFFANTGDNQRLISAYASFRNEPY